MAEEKTRRLLALTITLLSTRRYLSREYLREAVEGYRGLGDAAFERTFERDKKELRELGVPVGTGNNSAYFEDEPGYRIMPADYELPEVSFSTLETAVLGSAASVWRDATAAGHTAQALAKLRAAGIDPDTERLAALQPTLSPREEAFAPLFEAVLDRTVVQFGYRSGAQLRTVEPWRLVDRRGSWYLIGLDRGRGEPRVFKLSRMTRRPTLLGAPHAYLVPPGVDLDALAAQLEPDEPDSTAVLAIREGCAPSLRRGGELLARQPEGLPEGYRAWRVRYAASGNFLAELCAAAPEALVWAPDELRTRVVDRLGQVITTHGGAGAR